MNKIIYDIELQQIEENKDIWNYYYEYINQIKNKKDKVKLGLYCTKYCFEFNNEFTKPLAQKCIDLVESWLIDPKSAPEQDLLNAANAIDVSRFAAKTAIHVAFASYHPSYATINCLYYCSQIENIDMNLPHQYIQTLLRTTKQFKTNNPYSQTIEQIVKQDIDKLELVDYNMLLDISNEYYNIDLSEFCYDNIFSRRNLIETIRREYQ